MDLDGAEKNSIAEDEGLGTRAESEAELQVVNCVDTQQEDAITLPVGGEQEIRAQVKVANLSDQ